MGCGTSKLDDLPAVALCRERCSFLDEAILLRYSLSNSHLSYFHSLSTLSPSFSSFFPPLPHPTPSPKPPPLSSPSSPSSHIDFHDFSPSSGDLSPLHHDPLSLPLPNDDYGGFFHTNYMRNKASTPSLVFEQQPVSYHSVQFGETSSSSSSAMPPPGGGYPPYPYQKSSSSYPDNAVIGSGGGGGGMFDPNYGYPGYGSSGIGGSYYVNSSQRQSYDAQAKPPPPPPSPPRASALDFLNLFESYEKFYPAYTPSRDSKELREEEGIPDLEDEHEVMKEVHGNSKFIDFGKNHDHTKKGVVVEEEDEDDDDEDEFHQKAESEALMYQARPSVLSIGNDEGNDDGAEYEVHVVDKKVVDGERRLGQGGGGAARGSRSAAEALAEIAVRFRRASECGSEVAKMLEVGKLPYNRKHRGILL